MTTSEHQIDFIDGAFWGRNPQEELTWLRHNDPVHWDGRVWGITKAADVRDIATQPELFSNAQGIRPDQGPVAQMIDMDAPQHLWRRKLVSTGFTPRRVVQQEAKVLELTDAIIDRVCEKGECDLVKDVVAWLPIEVIGGALGFNPDDFGTLLEWSDALMCALTGDPDVLERAGEAFGGYVGYLAGAVAERREVQTDDLLNILVHAEVDGNKLSDDDLLHWVSPIRNMARAVTQDLTYKGKDMKAGQKLVLLYPSANRDEDVFKDPFTFDIARTPNEHLAFGVGPHFCLGNALARVEVKTMVDRLLERLPDLELVSPEEPEWRPANFVSGYEEMRVRFTPTAPVGKA